MKKILIIMLAVAMCLSMVACGNNDTDLDNNNPSVSDDNNVENNNDADNDSNEVEEDNTAAESIAAIDILNAVWEKYPEEEKPYYMGGYYDNFVEAAPATFDHTDVSSLSGLLIIPEGAAGYIDECASLYNAMNFNNFTCGSYHIADAANVEDFIAQTKDSILNNHWMCGFPEVLDIVNIGENNVVVLFGNSDLISSFTAKLSELYPDAVINETPIE